MFDWESPLVAIACGLLVGILLYGGIALYIHLENQPKCTVQELEKADLVVCTYKNKVLFNGEVKDEKD